MSIGPIILLRFHIVDTKEVKANSICPLNEQKYNGLSANLVEYSGFPNVSSLVLLQEFQHLLFSVSDDSAEKILRAWHLVLLSHDFERIKPHLTFF